MFDNMDKNKWLIFLSITNIISIILVIYFGFIKESKEDIIQTLPSIIVVEIDGEVANSDVYDVEYGMRLNDLIILAGGITSEANMETISRAEKLVDGKKYIIPNINDVQSDKININTAEIEELDSLHGIGKAKAQAIIEYREINGPFASIEEIKRVPGIGDSIFEGIKDDICS